MKKEHRAYSIIDLPKKDRSEIAFIGRSNSGKSSLINTICNVSTAKVSKKAGHTLWLGIHEVGKVRLIDLPGYGYAKVGNDRKKIVTDLVWDYLNSGRIDLIFLLIDSRRGIMDIDQVVINELDARCIPIKFIGTKADKKDAIKAGLDFYCSSHTKDGINELINFITNLYKPGCAEVE